MAKPPVEQIYDILAGMYGLGDSEIFQMEFPARLLEKGEYDYPGSDTINAQQIKPETVVDAEFRLSDDLYKVSNIMGGPSGVKLSNQYSDILFSLVPSSNMSQQTAQALHDDQDKICQWLTAEVDDFTPPQDDVLANIPNDFSSSIPARSGGDGGDITLDEDGLIAPKASTTTTTNANASGKIARVDLYQKLLNLYENERFRWATFKRNARPKDMSTATAADIDNLNRMLATFAPIVDKKLEALWTVLLVRGNYHRVRRFIGYVDVESASEILQRAKENLRSSVARSIDDSQDVYPVYYEPSDWARYLTTAFQPEDLLSSEDTVRELIFEKEKARASLISRRNALLAGSQDVAAAQTAVDTAASNLRQEQLKLTTGYSDTSVKVIQLFFDAYMAAEGNPIAAETEIGALTDSGRTSLNQSLTAQKQPTIDTAAAFDTLKQAQISVLQNQSSYQSASEALSRAMLAAAQARGSDATTALAELDDRIQSLTMDIEYMMQTLKASANATGQPVTLSNGTTVANPTGTGTVPATIQLPAQDMGASIWQEIVTSLTKSSSSSNTMNSSFSSSTDWNVGLFFGSASGSDRHAEALNTSTYTANDLEIQIGFRAMKVTLNRPWFDAGIFVQMQEYYHTNSTPISTADNTAVRAALGFGTRVDGSGQNVPNVRTGGKISVVDQMNEHTLLPSWPNAFIVVKDVHLIFTTTQSFDTQFVKDMQKSFSAGGGILCFSAGKSENSSEHRTAAAMTYDSTKLSIKIPAPQILGWICELCPKDNANSTYHQLDDSEFRSLNLGS